MLVIRTLAVPVRAWSWAVVLAGTGAQVVAAGLVPAGALAAAGLGTLTGAVMQLAFGTPYGSVAPVNVAHLVSQLGVTARDVCPEPYAPTWGVARFTAVDGEGRPLDIDIYGRDAPEGQLLSRLWRFVWIRNSTLDLRLRRADHAGHAAGLMLWARALDVGAPAVVAARRTDPAGDVVLVTRPPAGLPLSDMTADTVNKADLCAAWRSLRCLDAAGIALNAVRADTLVIGTGHQVAFTEFACGEAMAGPEARRRDAASLLIATALVAGPRRAVAIAADAVGRDRVIELASPHPAPGRAVAPRLAGTAPPEEGTCRAAQGSCCPPRHRPGGAGATGPGPACPAGDAGGHVLWPMAARPAIRRVRRDRSRARWCVVVVGGRHPRDHADHRGHRGCGHVRGGASPPSSRAARAPAHGHVVHRADRRDRGQNGHGGALLPAARPRPHRGRQLGPDLQRGRLLRPDRPRRYRPDLRRR